MMRQSRRSVTPVSVKNRKNLTESPKNVKSQQACITALALGNALNAEKMLSHLFSWSSTRIRSDCRSSLMAEAYALSNAVQHGHGLRTRAIVDTRGRLKNRQWEETVSAAMGHVWFTDCASRQQNVWRPTCLFQNNSSGTTVMIATRMSMDRRAIILVGVTCLRCCQSA